MAQAHGSNLEDLSRKFSGDSDESKGKAMSLLSHIGWTATAIETVTLEEHKAHRDYQKELHDWLKLDKSEHEEAHSQAQDDQIEEIEENILSKQNAYRVVWLDLFYDLIFVAYILEVGYFLKRVDDPHMDLSDWNKAKWTLRGLILFGTGWLTWWHQTMLMTSFRFMGFYKILMWGMTFFNFLLVCFIIDGKGADADNEPTQTFFADTYANMVLLFLSRFMLFLLYVCCYYTVPKARTSLSVYLCILGVEMIMLIVGATLGNNENAENHRTVLWCVALFFEMIMYPASLSWTDYRKKREVTRTGCQTIEGLDFDAEHNIERNELWFIIVIGESVLSIVTAPSETSFFAGDADSAEYVFCMMLCIVSLFLIVNIYETGQPEHDVGMDVHAIDRNNWKWIIFCNYCTFLISIGLLLLGVGLKLMLAKVGLNTMEKFTQTMALYISCGTSIIIVCINLARSTHEFASRVIPDVSRGPGRTVLIVAQTIVGALILPIGFLVDVEKHKQPASNVTEDGYKMVYDIDDSCSFYSTKEFDVSCLVKDYKYKYTASGHITIPHDFLLLLNALLIVCFLIEFSMQPTPAFWEFFVAEKAEAKYREQIQAEHAHVEFLLVKHPQFIEDAICDGDVDDIIDAYIEQRDNMKAKQHWGMIRNHMVQKKKPTVKNLADLVHELLEQPAGVRKLGNGTAKAFKIDANRVKTFMKDRSHFFERRHTGLADVYVHHDQAPNDDGFHRSVVVIESPIDPSQPERIHTAQHSTHLPQRTHAERAPLPERAHSGHTAHAGRYHKKLSLTSDDVVSIGRQSSVRMHTLTDADLRSHSGDVRVRRDIATGTGARVDDELTELRNIRPNTRLPSRQLPQAPTHPMAQTSTTTTPTTTTAPTTTSTTTTSSPPTSTSTQTTITPQTTNPTPTLPPTTTTSTTSTPTTIPPPPTPTPTPTQTPAPPPASNVSSGLKKATRVAQYNANATELDPIETQVGQLGDVKIVLTSHV